MRTMVNIPFQKHQASLPERIGYLKENSRDSAGKMEALKVAHDKRAKGRNHPR